MAHHLFMQKERRTKRASGVGYYTNVFIIFDYTIHSLIAVPILRRYITAQAELCNRINGALNKIAVFSQGLLLHCLVILMQAKAAYSDNKIKLWDDNLIAFKSCQTKQLLSHKYTLAEPTAIGD